MKEFLRRLCFLFLVVISFHLNAAHQAGGFLAYKCLGGPVNAVQYEISFSFYVDGNGLTTGNTPPDTLSITIFNSGVSGVRVFELTNLVSITQIPDNISNPCVVSSPTLDIREYFYRDTVTLDGNFAYTFVYQRCCKNGFIDNLAPPSNQYGNTYLVEVPNFSLVGCNSTPIFNSFPPLVLCAGFDVATDIDLSATDPDGDSLVYNYCTPLDYPQSSTTTGGVEPIPANSAPYSSVTFLAPQNTFDPIPSSPSIQINSQTGRFTGVPNALGRYLVGICVEEYRNGTLISTSRRDLEISTANCSPVITTAVQDQEQFCNGLGVQFTNNTTANINIQSYKWDFGDPTTLADTSRAFEPTYNFPSPGFYTITLISNPESPACSDTNTKVFEVRPLLAPTIEIDGQLCSTNSSVNFDVGGNFQNTSSFRWDFGAQASIQNSTNQVVSGVSYPGPGSYPVQLIVDELNCSDTVTSVVTLLASPTADFTLSESGGCFPLPVTFTSTVVTTDSVAYEWDFGDGNTSTEANPTNVYMADGFYNVRLIARTTEGCIDTLTIVKDSAVHVTLDSANNNIAFDAFPKAGCAPLEVNFTNQSTFDGSASFSWLFGDGTFSSDVNPMHTYLENGVYKVGLLMITRDKCIDTLFFERDSLINVSLDSSMNMIGFDFNPKEGCAPLNVQFSDSSIYEGGADYFWDFGDGTLSNDQNPTKLYTDTGTYDIGLLLIPTDKCVDTLVLTVPSAIKVRATPEAKINASDSVLSLKEAQFTFTNTGSEFFQSSRYLIDGIEVATTDILDYQFTDTGHFEVSYIAINDVGCEDTSSVTVLVFDEFQFIIPNVFTPNGDGVNDDFAMRACGVYEYEINIFNRYGVKVFNSDALGINWDGRVSGRKANSGTYYYTIRILDFKGEYQNYSGAVTLLRD